eukprot:m51a1_g6892 hypothetical protein (133) ;mRNA; f:7000-8450
MARTDVELPRVSTCHDEDGRVCTETTLTVAWSVCDDLPECTAALSAASIVARGPRQTTYSQAAEAVHRLMFSESKMAADKAHKYIHCSAADGTRMRGEQCLGEVDRFRVAYITRDGTVRRRHGSSSSSCSIL